MAIETLTYSVGGKGWTSRWSYHPDMMIGLNNNFYSWKDGSLYLHNSNETRNYFYDTNYNSEVTFFVNAAASDVKKFKTIGLDSTSAWGVEVSTEQDQGEISSADFVKREEMYFANIRKLAGAIDFTTDNVVGVGTVDPTGVLGPNYMEFYGSVSSEVSIGDKVYKADGSTGTQIGVVSAIGENSITMDPALIVPAGGDVIFVLKDSAVESSGVRGYFMEVKVTNSSQTEEELFEVSTNAFKSFHS